MMQVHDYKLIYKDLKNVTIEEAWAELMKLGYQNQYEGDWTLLHDGDDAVTTDCAVTLQENDETIQDDDYQNEGVVPEQFRQSTLELIHHSFPLPCCIF